MKKTFLLALLSVVPVLFSQTARAVPCSDLETGIFDNGSTLNTTYSACLDANTNNDSEKALNSGEFFGISDWTLIEKAEDGGTSKKGNGAKNGHPHGQPPKNGHAVKNGHPHGQPPKNGHAAKNGHSANSHSTGSDINLDVDSVGEVSGTFSFDSSIWDDYEEVAVVLKGGKTADGTKWSAYLLDEGVDEGYWIYGHGDKGQLKDLSHLTVYGSTAATVVPVPAAMWLFSSGLLALFAIVRRKS